MFDLNGKIAFITGGGSGIGLGIAKGLIEHGASVALASRNLAKLESAAQAVSAEGAENVFTVSCDVTDRNSVSDALDRTRDWFGGIDIVVNNAGVNRGSLDPHLMMEDDWKLVVDTNLTGLHNVSSIAFPMVKARGGGKFINIGSMTSIFGSPLAVAYASSKGGVVQYTKSCAVAWARYDVQVNALLPGYIETELTSDFGNQFPGRYKQVLERTPANRWGQPSDIAGAAVFLASDASGFVTGAAIPVDGGYSAM